MSNYDDDNDEDGDVIHWQVFEALYPDCSWITWTLSLQTETTSTVRWKVSVPEGSSCSGCSVCLKLKVNAVRMKTERFVCRGGTCNDVRHKPGHGHVLGNVPLERHGDNGLIHSCFTDFIYLLISHPSVFSFIVLSCPPTTRRRTQSLGNLI